MKLLLRKITETRSFTVIQYDVEEALEICEEEDKPLLVKLQNERSLDEIWAIAHEALGDLEEAKRIRAFVAARKTEPRPWYQQIDPLNEE